MSEPVELWCVINPDGGVIATALKNGTLSVHSADAREGYRCELLLLVRPGQMFKDGVEACISRFRELRVTCSPNINERVSDAFRALSPAPEPSKAVAIGVDLGTPSGDQTATTHHRVDTEADRLLRRFLTVFADEDADLEGKAILYAEIEACLKERG